MLFTNETRIIEQAGGENRAKSGPAGAGALSHIQIVFFFLAWPNTTKRNVFSNFWQEAVVNYPQL